MLNQDYIGILKSNHGFEAPEQWLEFASEENFEYVPSEKISCCPSCGSGSLKKLGQYVYYSNLVWLASCNNCDLAFSNVIINADTTKEHFEKSYKDETYFVSSRSRIFSQITQIISKEAPQNGSLLDVGGAKGHMLKALQDQRPDLKLSLNDVSEDACDFAKKEMHVEALVGYFAEVDFPQKYDVISLIDVLYYTRDLKQCFKKLDAISKDDTAIVMRIPNVLWLIKLGQFLRDKFQSKKTRSMQTKVALFNPEHLYIFTRKNLDRSLKEIGYTDIEYLPSAFLKSENFLLNGAEKLTGYCASLIAFISFNKIILTPSQLVVARKKPQ